MSPASRGFFGSPRSPFGWRSFSPSPPAPFISGATARFTSVIYEALDRPRLRHPPHTHRSGNLWLGHWAGLVRPLAFRPVVDRFSPRQPGRHRPVCLALRRGGTDVEQNRSRLGCFGRNCRPSPLFCFLAGAGVRRAPPLAGGGLFCQTLVWGAHRLRLVPPL